MSEIIEMKETMESKIEHIIDAQLAALSRPDLFRKPLIAFSDAADPRYGELKRVIGQWHQTPTQLLPDANSVISYFVPFTKEAAMQPKSVEHGSFLWSQAYQVINAHFHVINEAVIDYLAGLGYSAIAIKPTHTYDPKDLKCMWSHRSAAAIAGLGAFAANGLLITEKGAAGRFCTVITSAHLKSHKPPVANKCLYIQKGVCGLCFKACPVKALKPEGFDKFVCQDELNRNERLIKAETNLVSADTCGKCISVCPFAYIE